MVLMPEHAARMAVFQKTTFFIKIAKTAIFMLKHSFLAVACDHTGVRLIGSFIIGYKLSKARFCSILAIHPSWIEIKISGQRFIIMIL
jgi:hypothetical protein